MKSFLHAARPLITPLLVSTEEGALLGEIAACLDAGADAFGLCIERLPREMRTEEKIKTFFAAMGDKPIYVTCYLRGDAIEESDEERADMLIKALEWGATMADIRGDLFDPCEDELTKNGNAIERQKALIRRIHAMGKEALMSSHVMTGDAFRFLPKEEVLAIALEQQARGADMAKIVTNADTEEELLENFEAIPFMKKRVSIPVLFLCNGRVRMRHRLACGLISEPIVFVKEKTLRRPDSIQPPTEQMVGLFRDAGML